MGSFEHLWKYFKLPAITATEVEQFFCKLYGAGNSNIYDIQCTVFCSSSKITQYSLSPTKDELNLHVKSANYQPAIWRRVTTAYIDAPPTARTSWVDCWESWQHKYKVDDTFLFITHPRCQFVFCNNLSLGRDRILEFVYLESEQNSDLETTFYA